MYIKAFKNYNRDGEPVEEALCVGFVTTAGERKTSKSGKEWASAGIKVLNMENGDGKFITIKSFGAHVDAIANLCKGDTVLVAGSISTHEYNEKKYTDLLVDFMSSGDVWPTPAQQEKNLDNLSKRADDFAEVGDDDGELPF